MALNKETFIKDLTELIDNWLFETQHRGFHATKYKPLCELLWENDYRKDGEVKKETAQEIYEAIKNLSYCGFFQDVHISDLYREIFKEYGVKDIE